MGKSYYISLKYSWIFIFYSYLSACKEHAVVSLSMPAIQDSFLTDIPEGDFIILSPVKNKAGTKDSLLLLLERDRSRLSLIDLDGKKMLWNKAIPFPKVKSVYGSDAFLYFLCVDAAKIVQTGYRLDSLHSYLLDTSKYNRDISFPFLVSDDKVILNAIPKGSNLFTDSSRRSYFSARQIVQYDLSNAPHRFRTLNIAFPLHYLENDYNDSYPEGVFSAKGIYTYVFRHCDSLFLYDDIHKTLKVISLPKSISVQTPPMDKERNTNLDYAKDYETLSNCNLYIRYHKGSFYLFQKKATELLDASGKLNGFEEAPKQVVQLDTNGVIRKIYSIPQKIEIRGATFYNDMFITKSIYNEKVMLCLTKM